MQQLRSFSTNVYRFLRHDLYRRFHFAARKLRRDQIWSCSDTEVEIISSLNRLGGHVTDVDRLGLSSAAAFSESLPKVLGEVSRLKKIEGHKSYFSQLTEKQVLDTDLHLLGLDEGLLEIAQKYLGMPIKYRGVEARRDFLDNQICETRLWHRDPEDFRILKVIVYLSDVNAGGGPFEFFPVQHTLELDWAPKNRKGRLDDKWCTDRFMNKHSPATCYGKAGTVVLVDTCRVYHRGQLPELNDRHALFFSYVSSCPAFPKNCVPYYNGAQLLRKYKRLLSPIQANAIDTSKDICETQKS